MHDHEADEETEDVGDTPIGPNGGRLIVLGDKDFHAELVIDHENAEVTVWLLDQKGREPVFVDQDVITLNFRCDGRPHQIRLTAMDAGDTASAGRCRFRGRNEALQGQCQLTGRLNVIINGKPYTGQVAHHEEDHKMLR